MSNGSYSVYKTSLNSVYVETDRENKLWKRKVEKKKKKKEEEEEKKKKKKKKKETKRVLSENKVSW